MPPKKRTTKSTDAAITPAATPAITPNAAIASGAKAANGKKPAAKRPAAKPAKPAPVTVAASDAATLVDAEVVTVPMAADAPVAPVRSIISEDDIRRYAYTLSQSRRGPGDPVADWFEAERHLREQPA